MRRSFGPMGGGLMNTVHRAVRASSGGHGSPQDPFHHSSSTTSHDNYIGINSTNSRPTSSNNLSFSSNHYPSPFSSVYHPNRPNSMSPMNAEEYDDFVFCTVPSMDEVHHAISSLQHVLDPSAGYRESGWELDWIEPSISMSQSRGSQSVYDAFRLLQTDNSVKRMVMSLSSDKSVWDAVMNNEAVRELRDSIYQANRSVSGRSGVVESSDSSILVSDILQWILINIKAKVTELVEKTTEIVYKLFQAQRNEKVKGDAAANEPFEKKLQSSFLLTVMVLLVVVVSRASRF
uniref:uncharacterized protein LOC122603181 n=1 Tax=Erigeron canadensis TaxID=72917 RepID=UPI001CB90558|nr:uncharacterized protein LOC122603181 [Erigeron canadensis]